MKSFIFLLSFFLFNCNLLFATPEFSLWSGNKCSTCHFNLQGGGMRTEFGWTFGKDASTFTFDDLGLKGISDFIDKEKYSYFDGLLAWGVDFRYQTVRSHKTEDATRKYFPMQASFYVNSSPFKWLSIEGQYNIGPIIFAGQKSWAASILLNPIEDLPSLRVGFFQPTFGLRDCDMTSLDRRFASIEGTASFIPPDYVDIAAELIYENIDWLSISVGIADSRSLSEISLYGEQLSIISVKDNPSFYGRFIFYLKLLDDAFPETYLGSSLLINGDFLMVNSFIGIAPLDDVQLILRYSGSNKAYIRKTDNFIAGITFTPFKGIFLGIRGEYGMTEHFLSEDKYIFETYQIVANAKFFLLPYIELIPEYRYIDCEEYRSTRWAVQFHFYY